MMKSYLSSVMVIVGILFMCLPASAQRRISGTITDSQGEAVVGVAVYQEHTNNWTLTDANGKFSLNVPDGAVITVSCVGFKEQIFTVGEKSVYALSLVDEYSSLESAEVVAYGTQQRVSVTGALSSVKAESLTRTPVSSVNNILAGQLTGVTTVQYSGEPGYDAAEIYVRGKGTWGDSAPLIQVDGVERSMFDLNPDDIESITVLKDASATAVFGVRGANGVILVTTKRGAEGKAKVNVNTSFSVLTPNKLVRQADSYQYALFYNKMRKNDGEEPAFSDEVIELFRNQSDPIRFPSVQWTDYIMLKATTQQNHTISISGGSSKARYFVSAGFLEHSGLFNEFDRDYHYGFQYHRFNYRTNLDIDVTPTTLVSLNVAGVVGHTERPPIGDPSTILLDVFHATPFSSPGLIDDKFVMTTTDYADGPRLPFVGTSGLMHVINNGGGYKSEAQNKLQMDLALTQKLDFITKGLNFKIKGSYNSSFSMSEWGTRSTATYYPVKQADGTFAYKIDGKDTPLSHRKQMDGKGRDWYAEASLNYARTFGNHSVTALALYNQSKTYYPSTYSDLPRGYVGLVGRLTYDYKKRYLAEFNVGYNGSENFAPDRRYGFFPAGSAGWVVSDEPFFSPLKSVFSFFKLRASVGLVGNDKIGGNRFMYLSDPYVVGNTQMITRNGYGYNFGVDNNSYYPGAYLSSTNNPEVSWEKALKQNYGLDFNLFNDKLSVSVDRYKEHRTGILLQDATAPILLGFSVPYANLGIVDSDGWESSVKWSDRFSKSSISYWLQFNFSSNNNVIVEMKEAPKNNDFQYLKGHRIGSRSLYQFFRYYDSDTPRLYEETFGKPYPTQLVELKDGDAVFVDLDGNGVVDANDMTRDLGYTDDPKYVVGLNGGFTWKAFEMSMQWTGAFGVSRLIEETYRMPFRSRTEYKQGGLIEYMIDNTWDPENPSQNAMYPRATWVNGQTNNYQNSGLYEKDASYIRLKTLMIAYNFDNRFLRQIGIPRAQLALSGLNLLTFTSYQWGDPESSASSIPTYPLTRSYTVSLKINF